MGGYLGLGSNIHFIIILVTFFSFMGTLTISRATYSIPFFQNLLK